MPHRQQVPRIFYQLDSMPRLATGKIAKKALKDMYAEAHKHCGAVPITINENRRRCFT